MQKPTQLSVCKGPHGQVRPSDPIEAAAAVMRIVTGESDEATEADRALKDDPLKNDKALLRRRAKQQIDR